MAQNLADHRQEELIAKIDNQFEGIRGVLDILKKAKKSERKPSFSNFRLLSKYKLVARKLQGLLNPDSACTVKTAAKTLHYLTSVRTDIVTDQTVAFLLSDCLLELGLSYEFISLQQSRTNIIKKMESTGEISQDALKFARSLLEIHSEFIPVIFEGNAFTFQDSKDVTSEDQPCEHFFETFEHGTKRRLYFWEDFQLEECSISVSDEVVLLNEFCLKCNFCSALYQIPEHEVDSTCDLCCIGHLLKLTE